MSDPFRDISRYLSLGNRAISSGRRGYDGIARTIYVDPRRREAD